MSQVRVLLADDHKMVTDGLRGLLEPEFAVVGAVEDGRALLDAARALRPDVVVVDIAMPRLNGIDAVEQLRDAGSKAKVVFLTMHPDASYAARAFEAGASGYVLKHAAASELVAAIRAALQGHTYVTPRITRALMDHYKGAASSVQDPVRKLTGRQREVLQLLAEGHSAKQVASTLAISTRTVEFHKYKIMGKLGLRTSADLVHFAVKHGIVSA